MKKINRIAFRFLLCFSLILMADIVSAQPCPTIRFFGQNIVTPTTIQLKWFILPSSSGGGVPVTLSYRPTQSRGAYTTARIVSLTNKYTTFNLANLEPNTYYDFYLSYYIFQSDPIGAPRPCNASVFIRVKTYEPCGPPKNVTVTNISSTTAVVNWIPGSGGKGDYILVKGPDGPKVLKASPPYLLTGLTPSTDYEVTVLTGCSLPYGDFPNIDPRTNPLPQSAPPVTFATRATSVGCANVDFHVKSTGSDNITLGWTNGGPNVAGYRLMYSIEPGNIRQLDLPKTDLSYNIGGLLPNKFYTFSLITRCSDGSLFERRLSATTTPRCNLSSSVSNITDNSAVINISGDLLPNNPNNKIIYYLTDGSNQRTITYSGTSASISGLNPNTPYLLSIQGACINNPNFTMQTYNGFRTTGYSLPCQLASISSVTTGISSATVQWSIPTASGAPPVSSIDVCATPIYTGGSPICSRNLPASTSSATLNGLSTNFNYLAVVTLKCANGTETQASRTFNFLSGGSLVRSNDVINNGNEKSIDLPNVTKGEITSQTESKQKIDDLETPKWGKNIQSNLTIIPNPTKGDISILLPESGYENLTIANMNGQIVKQVQQPTDVLFQKMDCTDLPTGIYILSAKGAGKMVHSKFVKN
jgi:Secretion system C-terminal sorting domain/Fibronectin type III domain